MHETIRPQSLRSTAQSRKTKTSPKGELNMTGIELFILIGGCYSLYTVGLAIATEIDYRRANKTTGPKPTIIVKKPL